MLDDPHAAARPAPLIEVDDYIEIGRLVAEWATEPATRPADVAELRDQLAGIATVADGIRTVEFVQGTTDHLVVRLPAKELIEATVEQLSDPLGHPRLQVPQFYADHCRPGFGPVMTPLDTLFARVGDQSIAQCR